MTTIPATAFAADIVPSLDQEVWAVAGVLFVVLLAALGWILVLYRQRRHLRQEVWRQRQDIDQNEEILYRAFENSAIGVAISEFDGNFVFVNHAFCEFIGYDADELMSMSAHDVSYPDDSEAILSERQKLRTGEVGAVMKERQYRHRDGEPRWGFATITIEDRLGDGRHRIIAQIQDMTERKIQDEKLRDQSDRLNLTIETANLGTWVRNFEEDTLFWDPRTKQIFGIGADVRKRSFHTEARNSIHPDDRELVEAVRSAAENGTAEYSFEYRICWPSGEIRHVATRGTIMRDRENKPVRVIGTVMDITDLKRAEEQLERNQERLSRLHEITSDRTLSLNAMISKVLELGADTLEMDTGAVARYQDGSFIVSHAVDRRIVGNLKVVPSLDHELCLNAIQSDDLKPFEKSSDSETRGRSEKAIVNAVYVEGLKSGVLAFEGTSSTKHSFADDDRAFVQLMALWIGGEIERDRSAWALSMSQARFKDIAESASDWFWEMDSNYLYSYISDRGLEYYGLQEDQVLGKNWYDIVDEMEFNAEHDHIERHALEIKERRPFIDYDYAITASDGARVFLQSSGKPHFDHDGTFLGYRGITRDITIRKRAEEEIMRAKEAADLANKTKSRFLAAASHDLRQPLQAMAFFMSSLQILEKDGKKQGIIQKTQASLDALSNLLNSLLDISKLESGSIKPNFTNFEFSQIHRLVEEFTPIAAVKNLELRAVPSSLILRSDSTLLETIIRNLLANAVKYCDAGKILFGLRRRGENAVIEVWDTGRGISDEQLQLVFEEFYQVGNPVDSREHGLGLGLSIVQRCAALLEHRVDVKSEIGRGSVFSITVPIATVEEEVSAEPTLPELMDCNGGKILLIDDEAEILESTAFLLETLGFNVTCCEVTGSKSDIEDNIGKASLYTPDIIISDYFLGEGITGIDVVNKLREGDRSDVPVIILTGDISMETGDKAETNNFRLLRKPVRGEELHALVSEMLAAGG